MRTELNYLPEYNISNSGLIDPLVMDGFISSHYASRVTALSEGTLDSNTFKSLEWQNIEDIQNFQRAEITPKFAANVFPWDEKDSGNCYTHSIRTSELLEQCGYETGIAFVNEHAFLLVRSAIPATGFIYMVNADTRRLSLGELTGIPAEARVFPDTVMEDIATKGFTHPIMTSAYTAVIKQLAVRIESPFKYGKHTY